MIGTGNWYCAKCSRFIDNTLIRCEACGRLRGSARARQAALEEAGVYWVRVPSKPNATSPPKATNDPAAGKPTGLLPPLRSTPPPDGRRSRP